MSHENLEQNSTRASKSGRIWLRRFGFITFSGILVLAAVGAYYSTEIKRLHALLTLYEEESIAENFRSMDKMIDSKPVWHGGDTWEFERGQASLPETFTFDGEKVNVREFLEYTQTTGLAVLHNDQLVFEEYYLGNTESTPNLSMSVAKSFVSALVGIAIEEGHIENLMDPVTKYVPALKDSGYDGVPLKHVLQMSSGIRFNEEYGDFDSDINRMGRMMAFNLPIDEFVASLENEREPGTYNQYVSMDTQVLGMVLREATGKDFTSYFEEKLWKPVGMEADAYWLVDSTQMELVFFGLNCVLRDYARLGQLYLHNGRRGDQQIVPASWVTDSVTPDAPHLQPGDNPLSQFKEGYGYQWWLPAEPDGDYLAIGVYNQFIYVHPKHNIVVAKNSANSHYIEDDYISEAQSIEFFRAIVDKLIAKTE